MIRGREQAVKTCKLKNLHSCLVLTSLGTAACEAVALSWPARNTWPAPPVIGRATVTPETTHRNTLSHVCSDLNWAKRVLPCQNPAQLLPSAQGFG